MLVDNKNVIISPFFRVAVTAILALTLVPAPALMAVAMVVWSVLERYGLSLL